MRSFFHREFFASLILHLLVVALLWFFVFPVSEKNETQEIQIQVVEKPESKTATASSDHAVKPKMASSKLSRRQRLDKFFPSQNFQTSATVSKTIQKEKADDVGEQWKDPWAFGATIEGESKFGERTGFYHMLQRNVDSHLLFDSALAEFNHFGEVKIKFAVNEKGQLLEDTIQVQSLDRVLKVRAIWALRAALKKPLASNLHLAKPGRYWMASRMIFSEDPFCRRIAGANGPFLAFCRSTSDRPVADSLIEEITSAEVKQVETENPFQRRGEPRTLREIRLNLNFSYEQIPEYYRKKYRKETGFDPFQKEKADPAWDL